jgi:hypothetical protein
MAENLEIIQYSINNQRPLLIYYVNYNGEMTKRIVRNANFRKGSYFFITECCGRSGISKKSQWLD